MKPETLKNSKFEGGGYKSTLFGMSATGSTKKESEEKLWEQIKNICESERVRYIATDDLKNIYVMYHNGITITQETLVYNGVPQLVRMYSGYGLRGCTTGFGDNLRSVVAQEQKKIDVSVLS